MIPLYGSNADGDAVVEVDSQSVDDDLGTPFTARLLTLPISSVVGGYNHLRRVVQAIFVTITADLVITPRADGAEDPDQESSFTFDSAVDGQSCTADAGTDVSGDRLQLEIEVREHVGLVELGECDVFFQKKRSRRV